MGAIFQNLGWGLGGFLESILVNGEIVPQPITELERDRETSNTHVKDEIVFEIERLVIRRCAWHGWMPEDEQFEEHYELAAITKDGEAFSLFVDYVVVIVVILLGPDDDKK